MFAVPLYAFANVVAQGALHEEYEAIERMIESSHSPVGIDAKKTHVLIMHKLAQLDRRLRRIEPRGRADEVE